MESILPQIRICSIFLIFSVNICNPGFHAVILLFQNPGIPVNGIQPPGNDHCCISPGRRSPLISSHRRNHLGHQSARMFLFQCNVMKVFSEERIAFHVHAGGLRKDLGISGPSHFLIPLRTVCGNINKVPFLAPHHIFHEPVQQGMARLKLHGIFQCTAQHHACKVLFFHFRNSCNPDVLKTEKA